MLSHDAYVAVFVLAVASLLAGVIAATSICVKREHFAKRLPLLTAVVLQMSICDAVHGLWGVITYGPIAAGSDFRYHKGPWCTTVGFFGDISQLASLAWYTVICYHVFRLLSFTGRGSLQRRVVLENVLVWGSSLILAGVPLVAKKYQPVDGIGVECWISKQSGDGAYRATFFVPLIVECLLAIALLVYALVRVGNVLLRTARTRLLVRMVLFVGVFVLCSVFPIADRVNEEWVTESPQWLQTAHFVGSLGRGVGNFLVWITSSAFREALCAPAVTKQETTPLFPHDSQFSTVSGWGKAKKPLYLPSSESSVYEIHTAV